MYKTPTKVELKKNCKKLNNPLRFTCKEKERSYKNKMAGGEINVLKDLISEKLVKLNIQAKDWEDAIRQAAQPLIDEKKVQPDYVEDMIRGAKEIGPYFVLTEHVALPHARPEAGALESAIGIATLKNPVEFGNEANDPVKYLFCLSAKDDTTHMNALAELAGMFENKSFFEILDNAKDTKEVLNYIIEK